MTLRERQPIIVAGILGIIALTAIVACAQMHAIGSDCPRELLNIAFTAVGALGGALVVQPSRRERHNGTKPQPPTDPPTRLPFG